MNFPLFDYQDTGKIKRNLSLMLFVILFLMATVPCYLLVTLPVTWNCTDSKCVLYYDIYDFHSQMPLSPPFYLSFTRILAFIWGGPHSYGSLLLIILSQQLIACGAITTLAFSTSNIFWRRLVVVLAMLVYAPIFLYNHGIWAEGLVISLIILQAAAALRLFRSEKDLFYPSLLYYGSLLVNLLVRHSAIIMGGLLPALLLMQALRFRDSKWWIKRFLVSVLFTVMTVAVAQGVFRVACYMSGAEYRSVMGKYACYWWDDYYWYNSGTSKAQVVMQMQSMTTDPLVRAAIPLVAHAKKYYMGAYLEVFRLVEVQYPDKNYEYYNSLTDKILNQVSWLFFRTMNRPWLTGARQNFLRYFTADESNYILNLTGNSAVNLFEPKAYLNSLGHSSGEGVKVVTDKIESFHVSIYMQIASFLSVKNMSYILCFLILIGYLFRIIPVDLVNFSVILAALGFLHLLVVSFLTISLDRYVCFTSVTLLVSILVLLANFHYPSIDKSHNDFPL